MITKDTAESEEPEDHQALKARIYKLEAKLTQFSKEKGQNQLYLQALKNKLIF